MNIKFMGEYKQELQLLENSNLPSNSHVFEESLDLSKSFIQGLLFALPLILVMIFLVIICFKTFKIDVSYNIFHFGISCIIPTVCLYVHEIIHALCYPVSAVKQIWMDKHNYSLFVYCNESVSKVRFVIICLMPSIILGIIPYLFSLIFIKQISCMVVLDILIITCINILSAVGDFTNVYNTLKQVPKKSMVINYGFHSYWF